MKNSKYIWVYGLAVTLLIVIIPIVIFAKPNDTVRKDDPWAHVTPTPVHTDHSALMTGPYEKPQDVTHACLQCHPDAAKEVQQTTHWTWLSKPVYVPERGGEYQLGKANAINNFCIGIVPNYPACTTCHVGYGWKDENFDFSENNQDSVDCLACHDNTGIYKKGKAGIPDESVDLVAAAQSVGTPNRNNCGMCHFNGGGGNRVKHGDLDQSLIFPDKELDVHMGGYDFQCVTCHTTEHHDIRGKATSVSLGSLATENQAACTDCHSETPHADERINEHTDTVACQTCHIPAMARKESTKIFWDWSQAGHDLPESVHEYLKIKGSFTYLKDLEPEYYWYNGQSYRYLAGDKIDPSKPTPMNHPKGDINDPTAKIWPFKVHRGKQPYDTEYKYFLLPKTFGEGGFWTDFNWDQAFRLGAEANNLPYSGHYDFAPTEMFWSTTHMVAPKEDALQCVDCHSETGRLDWVALGYPGDPIEFGGRDVTSQPVSQNVNSEGAK